MEFNLKVPRKKKIFTHSLSWCIRRWPLSLILNSCTSDQHAEIVFVLAVDEQSLPHTSDNIKIQSEQTLSTYNIKYNENILRIVRYNKALIEWLMITW